MSAIKDAALQRLRPILMTSASTVLGLIPLAFATGEGCNQRVLPGRYGSSRWYGRFYPTYHVYRTGYLQLYLDQSNQKLTE
ncbi:efflux RND transporter permease subunit [Bacteroides ovatus]|nr:efflux RND transporter permease subunit [Bacteroides ovatus]